MKTRDVYLVSGQTLKDSDTVTIDITKGLKILYLIVKYSNTNGATSNTLARLASMVSKLSVIDGSTVLHALSMDEEQAWNFYQRGRLPYQSLTQAAAGVVTEEAIIDFRRSPADTNFYLDTSRYQNPQLQFTHSFTVSSTAGFATGDGTLTVIARVIDSGADANQGFIMAKEIDSFANAASGDHNTDLPLDFPISHVIVLNPVDGDVPDANNSNFKLTADTDSFIPINESWTDLLQANEDEYGLAEQAINLLAGTTYTQNTDLYYHVRAAQTVSGTHIAGILAAPAGNKITAAAPGFYGTSTSANTATTSEALSIAVRGAAVKSSVAYKFGDGYTPANIFSPTGVGKLQLKVTMAEAVGTPKVVIVQQHS